MLSLLSTFTLDGEEDVRLKYDPVKLTIDMGENEYGEHSQLEALRKLSTSQLVVTNSGINVWNAEEKVGISMDFASIVLHALLAGEGTKVMVQVEAGSIQVDNDTLEEEDFDEEDDEFIASWDVVFELADKTEADKLMSCISECWSFGMEVSDDEGEEQQDSDEGEPEDSDEEESIVDESE